MRLRAVMSEQKQQQSVLLAKAKFQELDADNSGFLESAELDKVCEWVLSAGGNSSTEDKDETKAKVMSRVDANRDGKLDLEEFCYLFDMETRKMSILKRARAKFLELDADGR